MPIIKKYLSEVVEIKNPIDDVYVVSFRSLDRAYRYLPGQFLHLALDEYNPSSPWPESRCFSIQSNEKDELLTITYSVNGQFTKRMAVELTIGRSYYLKMPYGELFTQNHSKENAVFIAGGTGITPYLSLFTADDFAQYVSPVLYLGVRNPGYNIYNDYLAKANSINASFEAVIQNQDSSGLLDIEAIYKANTGAGVFFISGPPVMIKSFRKYLIDHGVDEKRVCTDEWE